MPIKSAITVEVPQVSVPTWVFGSPDQQLPDNPVIIDPEAPDTRFLSLASYRRWAQRFAAGLRDAGLQVGDTVLLASGNTTAYCVVYMGTLMAGGVISGCSSTLEYDKFARQATELQPAFIFAEANGYASAKQVATEIRLDLEHVFLFDDSCLFVDPPLSTLTIKEGQCHWAELLKTADTPFDWSPFAKSDQLAAITYTSGSTGVPKGTMASHFNLVANAVQYTRVQDVDPKCRANGFPATWVMWLPMWAIVGQTSFCMMAPKRGTVNYIMAKFSLEPMLRFVERYEAAEIFVFPSVLIEMLSHPATNKYNLSSVRTAYVAGAPLRASVLQRFRDIMPNKSLVVLEGWGMTEATGSVTVRFPLNKSDVYSQGELVPNYEAKVMTPNGQDELGPNQPGEIWIRSPSIAQGYLKRPEITEKAFLPGGWFRTGDYGYYDVQHNWFIKDRVQDIIYHESGAYALPTDIESTLINIPGVKDAGVTSIPTCSASTYKLPRAFVVLDHSIAPDIAEVAAKYKATAQLHEQLTGGIFEIDVVPRLPSGKIDRVGLRAKIVRME